MSRRSLRTTRRSSRAALVEALETRILLYDHVFNGTNGGESIFAQMQGANLVVGINGGSGIAIPNPAGRTVLISALGGNDQVHIVSNGGAIITVDAGGGDDIIQLGGSGSGQNLDNLPGATTLMGGSGNDTVLLQDGNKPIQATYTITDARFDRPGWGGFFYRDDIESLRLFTTRFSDTVDVRSTFPNQPIRIINQGDVAADRVNVGNPSQGVQGIRGNVYIEATGTGKNTIHVNDTGDTTARSANFDWDGSSAWGALNNLAPARIIWQAASTANLTVTSGAAADSFVLYGINSPLVLDSAFGPDNVQIGSPLVGGLISILQPVVIENANSLTQLSIINEGNSAHRSWTIDSADGYGSLVGMAPAPIYWDNLDVGLITLKCGNGADVGLIKRFSKTLNINNSSGSTNIDIIRIGSGESGGVQQITGGGITIDNDPWYTHLEIEDISNTSPRNATLDFVNGYNVLTGLAPATIRYNGSDVKRVAIRTGTGLSTVNVLRTTLANGETVIGTYDFFTNQTVNLGNPTTGLQSIIGTSIFVSRAGPLTLDNRADTAARNVRAEVNQIQMHITGISPGVITYNQSHSVQLLGGSGADTYIVAATSHPVFGDFGVLELDTGPGDDVVSVGGTQVANLALLDPVVGLSSLAIQNGSSVSLAGPANQVLVTGSIDLNGTGTLDVRDKAVIVNYSGTSPIESIRASVSSGYNAGAWTGNGIRSSTAATTAGTAVGFAEATELFSAFPASFAGQSVDNTSVLLRHTLNGDANLDGFVNLADFNRLAANFGQSNRTFSQGDFNYDGTVNLADFNILAARFGSAIVPNAVGKSTVDQTNDDRLSLLTQQDEPA